MNVPAVPSEPPPVTDRWWADAVGYEVYVRSFADSSGDGSGDLRGITDHLDHLAWLGIDVAWLTPFFASPMADFGYDVADYTAVDPLFGTLADFDALLERAHSLGIRVICDLVPNHTSDRHPWFTESRSSRQNPFRDYYIWRDPAPDGGPPNNWLSHFGGPAWTLDETTGQYYCHLFLPEQPDLNWRSPVVQEEFEKILRFWLERGIDGFRIDVAHALHKDEQLRDNPMIGPLESTVNARDRFDCLDHLHDLLQPETLDVYRRWRQIAADFDAILVGETYVLTAEKLARLVPGDGLDIGFWFGPMFLQWNPADLRDALRLPVDQVVGGIGWVLSSHDASRPVTRFGGGDIGRRRSLALTTMMFGLPGLPFLYQGEELGLADARLDADQLADPLAVRNQDTPSRDVCRTPMPWADAPNLGFSSGPRTWLPLGHTASESVAAQRDDPDSHLHLVRRLIAVRRALGDRHGHAVEWLDLGPTVIAYQRGDLVFALNASNASQVLPISSDVEIVYRTARDPAVSGTTPDEPVTARQPQLEPDETIVARYRR